MPRLRMTLAGIVPLVAATMALGASGEATYKAKCAFCHDGGATGAPRIDDKAAWSARLAQGTDAVYQTALMGKPNTAMMSKGGFPELADADVRAAVDYMLLHAGRGGAPPTPSRSAVRDATAAPAIAPPSPSRPVEDRAIVADVAEALRKAPDISPPNARLETSEGVTIVRGVGIRIEARDGVVTLQGVVERASVVARAEAIARTVGGVKSVDNKLIASSIFEHD